MTVAAVTYDDEVGKLIDEVEGLLMRVRSQRGAQREFTLKTAGGVLRDCKKKWHQLKVEVQELPNSDKPRFDKKVKLHSDKLDELNVMLQKLKPEVAGAATFSESAKSQDDGKQEVRNIHARTKGHQERSLQTVATIESILRKTEQMAESTYAKGR
eukprot:TRINITY_DN3246_c0_g1_i3.p1 TRINITY_DN3246_c0_g1~~TRINITY_DN3246_c0_g1_i3.p1  ORF type:complete len:156 (+),score=41.92 TRINITY_DN3246_c0_g1_i3:175-642(+)